MLPAIRAVSLSHWWKERGEENLVLTEHGRALAPESRMLLNWGRGATSTESHLAQTPRDHDPGISLDRRFRNAIRDCAA